MRKPRLRARSFAYRPSNIGLSLAYLAHAARCLAIFDLGSRYRDFAGRLAHVTRRMPPHHAAGTVMAIPTIQNQRGALSRNSIIAITVNAIWIAPMITACRTSEPRASHAVTYPPQATHKVVYTNIISFRTPKSHVAPVDCAVGKNGRQHRIGHPLDCEGRHGQHDNPGKYRQHASNHGPRPSFALHF